VRHVGARVQPASYAQSPAAGGRGWRPVRQLRHCLQDAADTGVGGVAKPELHGVDAGVGGDSDRARALNRRWLTWVQERRPWVTLKAAVSLDGRIATRTGQSKWITGEAARRREGGVAVAGCQPSVEEQAAAAKTTIDEYCTSCHNDAERTADAADRGERYALIADISLGVAVAAGIATAVLVLTRDSGEETPAQGGGDDDGEDVTQDESYVRLRVLPMAARGGGGVAARVDF